ncbi:hypothetical protein [Defluviitalea saccharophila]|uniref:Membrane protein YkvI n=1 Tax=Defluviitalea saccharophila TaxID=879970 RepID=A0ABZ2Y2V4_9FIRM|nr:hypothetical protein [Candidatus Epulonipiscium sp.]
MRKKGSNIIKIASVYTGTVLGAGFASGQEIMQFFTSYGIEGIYGVILSGILFALIGWAVLEMVYVRKIKDYRGFIYPIMGEFLGNIMEWVVSLFMFITFCAMLAGTGALLRQQFQIPVQIGILVMAGLCFFVFLYDVKGVIAINTILAPLLLIGGILLGVYIVVFRETAVFSAPVVAAFRAITRNWITSSIVYVSYNTITAVVILCSLLPIIHSKSEARRGGILGGVTLGILGFCIVIATLLHYDTVEGLEIPMLAIVLNYGSVIEYIYLFVLIAAIFTTAVASGYGFINRVAVEFNYSYKSILPIFTLTSIIIAQIGFSKMVGQVYPLFGYVGLFEVFVILLYFISGKFNRVNKRFRQ